jgi:peptidoglycan/LPS O-acetylase OafA/YrhL
MFFSALGRMSMSIYVAHIVAASGLRILLTKMGFAGGPSGYFILCVAAGLIAPITMHLCLERLNLLWVFGLGKRRRSMHTIHIAPAS